MNKIFGIGLDKTGTTSLQNALNILGFNCFHSPNEYEKAMEEEGRVFPSSIFERYDAFCDYPFPDYYKDLDERFPNSKFILTTRDLSSWLASVRNHVRRNQWNPFYKGAYLNYDEQRLRRKWEKHREGVLRYFKNRPQDLLVFKIIDGEGWVQICPFLNRPVPKQPFPHENRSLGVIRHLIPIFRSKLRSNFFAKQF